LIDRAPDGVWRAGSAVVVDRPSKAATDKNLKMAFIQFMPHTVPAAWSKGIEDVLSKQGGIDSQLLDGQAKIEVQISLMDTQINDGANVIFLQPVDSVAIGPSIAKAKRAGISVITLHGRTNPTESRPTVLSRKCRRRYGKQFL
jgi:ABC-type sugar transport system substrate-binding protein